MVLSPTSAAQTTLFEDSELPARLRDSENDRVVTKVQRPFIDVPADGKVFDAEGTP